MSLPVTDRPRPKSAGLLQVALTVAMVVLFAAVTLTTRQPPPPAIAEFAPEAAEQIKEQPKEQASQFGSGTGPGDCPPGAQCEAGAGAGAGVAPGPDGSGGVEGPGPPGPPKIGPASLKQCVGDPPRQIEDPQSPPCIPYWDDSKGNGGATSPGVTADTITIVADDSDSGAGIYNPLTKFFNKRFQFYGRQLRVITADGAGTARADSAKQLNAFASLTHYSDPPYYRQLVRHKIVGFYRTTDFSDTELAASSPYLWGYTKSFTQIMSDMADWACRRLVGQKPTLAGMADTRRLSDSERSFGVFLQIATPDSTLTPDVFKAAVESCGAKVPFTRIYGLDTDAFSFRNDLTQLKNDGVTDLICLCRTDNLTLLQNYAETMAYQPEWIITNYPQLAFGDPRNGSQMDRTFGISFEPMERVPDDHPQIWAQREADPTSVPTRDSLVTSSNDIHYRGFLALASGIQMAGPNLTPETFRAGLHKTKFPNPDHPIMAGKVGFQGDFSMTDDAAEFWNSNTEPGPYDDTPRGPAFCWVDGGRRHARGTWPKSPPVFSGPCDSGRRPVS